VAHERDPLEGELGQEPLEERGQARERVVEVGGLAGATEADQVRRDAPGSLE
jgi:hypothetical protein